MIVFKQTKPLTVKILGVFLFCVLILLIVNYNPPLSQLIVMGLLSILLIGYSVSFEIHKDYSNKKVLRVFGIQIGVLLLL